MSRFDAFLNAPIAHRGLHDLAHGRPENSLAAIRAAIAHGYGIEIDLQASRDRQAMVFHDYDLGRLTSARGPVAMRDAAALAETPLTGSTEGIPTLAQVLDLVAGQVPLLIEIKDQHGAMGPTDGRLETAAAEALRPYAGSLAVMSFNPHAMVWMADLLPEIPRGLVTCGFAAADWPLLPDLTRKALRDIPDFEATGASFLSHDIADLTRPRVAALKARGVPVLCWTVRSPADAAQARQYADNITFENYLPKTGHG